MSAQMFHTLFIIYCLMTLSHCIEYCWETFNATCPDGHVIQMDRAQYGRMKLGKCLDRDYYVGCQAEILTQMERKCSGRRSCTLDIPDNDLHKMQPCPKDLVAYLDAEYSCLKVAESDVGSCRLNSRHVITTESSGFISSLVAEDSGESCSWLIKVPEGQTISLSLIDYAWLGTAGSRRGDQACVRYGSVREGVEVMARLCGGERRQKVVYESRTNSVIMEIVNMNHMQEKRPYFLIKYQAVGCRNLKWPQHGYVERRGEKATVSCNYTTDVSHLVCNSNNWVGSYPNCTSVSAMTGEMDSSRRSEHSFPFGVFLAVAIGIALGVFTGLLLLSTVICCRRERRLLKERSLSRANVTWPSGRAEEELECQQTKSCLPSDNKFCYNRVCNDVNHHVTQGQGHKCSCTATIVRLDSEGLYSPTKVFREDFVSGGEGRGGLGYTTRVALVSGQTTLLGPCGTPSFFLEQSRPQPQGDDTPNSFLSDHLTEDIYRD